MSNNVKLEQLTSLLQDSEYYYLGHGTGRNDTLNNIVDLIFEHGLRTKDNSLYYTTIGLDTKDINALEYKFNNWFHLDSKKIIIIRLPIKFINMLGNSSDLDGEKFGAFMQMKKYSNNNIKYYLDSKFIIGCYDANTKLVRLNENFEQILSKNTLQTLNENYKKILIKTKQRLKKTEYTLPINSRSTNKSEQIYYNLEEYDNFDDEIIWNTIDNMNNKSL